MVKHSQTIRRLLATNFLSVFDQFVGLALRIIENEWDKKKIEKKIKEWKVKYRPCISLQLVISRSIKRTFKEYSCKSLWEWLVFVY